MIAIEFSDTWKSFKIGLKRSTVLHGITFDVEQGSVFGFLGPNGAGKSTSIKLLLNFIRPDKGAITVNGLDTSKAKFQHFIGYLPETPCFFENLTGLETLRFAGKACGMDQAQIDQSASDVLARLKLSHAGNSPIRTYSKGMKQRIGLAAALIHDPDIYILDEPMSGLDPMGRRLIIDVILELRDKGKTVFFSSHILSDIERVCDRIGILNKGRLLFCGGVNGVMADHKSMEDAFIHYIDRDERASHA
jgi:ABC-2 type transport system ATP-binding protein